MYRYNTIQYMDQKCFILPETILVTPSPPLPLTVIVISETKQPFGSLSLTSLRHQKYLPMSFSCTLTMRACRFILDALFSSFAICSASLYLASLWFSASSTEPAVSGALYNFFLSGWNRHNNTT